MKKLFKIIPVILMLLVVLCISACGGNTGADDKPSGDPFTAADLVGKWKGTGEEISTITFGKNGSYKDDAGFAVVEGTYTVDEAARTITVNEKDYGLVFVYSAELSGNNLTIQIEGGLPRTFTRK